MEDVQTLTKQNILSPVYLETVPESPLQLKRRRGTFSRISQVSRNFTDKVANFHQKNPMIMMILIAIAVALLAPALLPMLL